jgi:hypothetical protein
MATITYAASAFTFNSVTYNNTSGGVMRVTVEDNSRELETRVGDNLYPTSVEAVDASCVVTVSLSEFGPTIPTMGTSSNLVATLVKNGGTETETFYNMKYMGNSANQDRASSATIDMRFVFQSDDGVNGPKDNPA